MVVPGTGTTLMGCSRPYAAVPVYQAPQQPPPPLIQQISEDDLKMVIFHSYFNFMSTPRRTQRIIKYVIPIVNPSSLCQQVEEMFPNLDKDVIKSVLEVNSGNREATINSLLQMSQ